MPRLSSRQRRVRDVLKTFLHHHATHVKAALRWKNKTKRTLTHAGFMAEEINALASASAPAAFDTLSIKMTSGSEPESTVTSVGSDVSSLSSGIDSESSDNWSDLLGSDWRGVSSSSSASSEGSDDASDSSSDGMPELHPAGYPDLDDDSDGSSDSASDSDSETSSSSGGDVDDASPTLHHTQFLFKGKRTKKRASKSHRSHQNEFVETRIEAVMDSDPPMASVPSSQTVRPPDNLAVISDERGSPRSTTIAGDQRSSSLPSLTPSLYPVDYEVGRNIRSRNASNSSADRASVNARLSSSLVQECPESVNSVHAVQTPNRHRASVHSVTDEDDVREGRIPTSSRGIVVLNHSQVNKVHLTTTRTSEEHSSPRPVITSRPISVDECEIASQDMLSSSPYPEESQIISDHERRARRAEKKRRSSVESQESADMHQAAAASMLTAGHAVTSEELDANIEAARATLACERAIHESPEEFRRRQDAYQRSARQLRDLRVQDDHEFAMELVASELRDIEHTEVQAWIARDREYAEEIGRKERTETQIDPQELETTRQAVAHFEASAMALEQLAADNRKEAARRQSILSEYLTREMRQSRSCPTADAVVRGAPKAPSYVVNTPLVPQVKPERLTHAWYNHVVLQWYRLHEIEKQGSSLIKDQGISWDETGRAVEVGPAPSRGSSVGTRGGNHTPSVVSSRHSKQSEAEPKVSPTPAVGVEVPPPTLPAVVTLLKLGITVKAEQHSQYYSRAGTTPVPGVTGTVTDINRPQVYSQVKIKSTPDGGSDSSDSDSSSSDSTYQHESTYSRDEDTDSVWEKDPSDVVSEVTAKYSNKRPEKTTRSGNKYVSTGRPSTMSPGKQRVHPGHAVASGAGGGGGPPNDSSDDEGKQSSKDSKRPKQRANPLPSSSEESESSDADDQLYDRGHTRGPSTTPQKYPQESERDRQRRKHRNSRRNHHSSGSRSESQEQIHLLEPGDPVTQDSPRMSVARREDIKHKLFKLVKHDQTKARGRDGGGSGVKTAPDGIKCYRCGGAHYKRDCTEEESFAARGVVDDNSEEEAERPPKASSSKMPPVKQGEQLRAAQESGQEDASSEGEYTLEEFSNYNLSDSEERGGGMRERCAHMSTRWDTSKVGVKQTQPTLSHQVTLVQIGQNGSDK
ncbi:hypothetical protein C8R44DRAFT_730786 [Mycena epipterygia]|nr:hypothetical protein C8R44DRAFT_730786 [Mycena epipterygia]